MKAWAPFYKAKQTKLSKHFFDIMTNSDLAIMNSYARSIGDSTSACFTTVIHHHLFTVSPRLVFWCTSTENQVKCFLQNQNSRMFLQGFKLL